MAESTGDREEGLNLHERPEEMGTGDRLLAKAFGGEVMRKLEDNVEDRLRSIKESFDPDTHNVIEGGFPVEDTGADGQKAVRMIPKLEMQTGSVPGVEGATYVSFVSHVPNAESNLGYDSTDITLKRDESGHLSLLKPNVIGDPVLGSTDTFKAGDFEAATPLSELPVEDRVRVLTYTGLLGDLFVQAKEKGTCESKPVSDLGL